MPRLRTESGARHALKSHVSSAIIDIELDTLRAVFCIDVCHHQTDSLESLGALWMLQNLFSCQRTTRTSLARYCDLINRVRRPDETCGAERDRTDDLRLAKPALSQLSYSPVCSSDGPLILTFDRTKARGGSPQTVGQGRVELPTSRLSGVRSNHLSYWPGGG